VAGISIVAGMPPCHLPAMIKKEYHKCFVLQVFCKYTIKSSKSNENGGKPAKRLISKILLNALLLVSFWYFYEKTVVYFRKDTKKK